MLLLLPLSLLSQVTRDFATFDHNAVDLVFICELNEEYHKWAPLPLEWTKIGADEFLLAMAPGWTAQRSSLKRVWPDVKKNHKQKGWRLYLETLLRGGQQQQQAAAGSRRQQEAAGGSRRQHHQ